MRIRQRSNGFTLIEIIMSLAVLGIGLAAVLAYLPVALDAAKKNRDISKAVLMARHHLERVRAAGFDTILNADVLDTGGRFDDDPNYPGFQYRIEIFPPGAAQIKDIHVSIRWRERGNWASKTMSTAIVKYNPG